MSTGKLRAAVVGVGYLGNFHAQKYKSLTQVELVGVCDTNLEQAKKIAGDLGVKAFSEPQELIGQVDLVTIASTTSTHYELAKLFLNNGIHVNVEKPMTVTAAQAEELVMLATNNNLRLAVGHVERFSPTWLMVKPQIKKPLFAEFTRHATFKARGADVSVIEDVMIHDLDLALAMAEGSKLESLQVSGSRFLTGQWDFVTADLKFANGFRAFVSAARVSAEMNRTFRVIEANCAWWVNLGSGEVIQSIRDEAGAAQIIKTQAPKADALLKENEVFIEAVGKGTPLLVSGQEGLDALKLAERIRHELGY